MTNVDLSFLGTPEWAAFIDRAERESHMQAGLGWNWKEFIQQAQLNSLGPGWGDYINNLPPPPQQPGLPPAPTPPASQTPGIGNQTDDPSAKAILMDTLGRYGLASLGDFAWREYLAGVPIEQILLDIRETPEYKKRFPAMWGLAADGRAMSEAEYINYEQSAMSLFKAAGLPPGFYDQPDDFTGFLLNDIALPELEERVNMARVAVYNSDLPTLQAIEEYYNVAGDPANMIGDLTAFFLDETRAMPLIQQQFIAAQTAGAAARSGYGSLSRSEAERLAQLGIDPAQAAEGFGTLARMEELFTDLPGEGEGTGATREQGLQGMFEGNAEAQAALERVAARRRSQFGQGGGYTESQRGLAGIG